MRRRKPFSTESLLLISIDPEPIPETFASMGEAPLLVLHARAIVLRLATTAERLA